MIHRKPYWMTFRTRDMNNNDIPRHCSQITADQEGIKADNDDDHLHKKTRKFQNFYL